MSLRVLHTQNIQGIGGSEKYLLQLLPKLQSLGVQVAFAGVSNKNQNYAEKEVELFYRQLNESGIRFDRVDSRSYISPSVFRFVVGRARAHNAEILHSHLIYADFWSALSSLWENSFTRVSTIHGYRESIHEQFATRPQEVPRDRYWRVASFNQSRINHSFCCSESLRDFYLKAGFKQASDWPVIHHGFDFPKSERSSQNSESKPVIVIVGRLVPRKGILMALRIFKKLREAIPAATMKIVGDGSQRQELEEHSKVQGLSDSVQFMGFQANPQDFLSASDQVWVPSYAEGLPLVIFEAMHSAKPIVAFDTIGSKDLIQHGQNGMLASAFDEAEFLHHALWLHHNPVQSTRLGAQAKQDAEANFSLQSMGENTLRFYQQVLA